MNRVVSGAISLVLAAGLAAGAAMFATDWLHDHRAEQVAAQAEPLKPENRVERVTNALEGLADDGVYVAPDARNMLDKNGERKVARAIARSDTPVKVVVWSPTSHAGASSLDLDTQLASALGADGASGVYLLWEGPESGAVDAYGPERGFVGIIPSESFAGDPAVTLPRLVRAVDDEVTWTGRSGTSDYWGGTGGGIAAGVLMAVGVLLALGCAYALLVWVVKRRRSGNRDL